MALTVEEKEKLEYFQKHALPWLIEHMKFRAIGLQVYIPIQGVLFGAWHLSKSPMVACFGIAVCICFFLWDERIRFIILRVHEWGKEIADKHFFPLDKEGNPTDGVHVVFCESLKDSGRIPPRSIKDLGSHTIAIRTLLVTTGVMWLSILLGWLSA